jgi:hypothetical protein
MTRAYFAEPVADFLVHDCDGILGALAMHHQFDLDDRQKNAWMDQIAILKRNLSAIQEGYILFEYSIPRMGRRVDVVLLTSGIVFILEFKVGDTQYSASAVDQALDYALDLKNFHAESHSRPIVPIVVATEAFAIYSSLQRFEDKIYAPLKANKDNLEQIIGEAVSAISASEFDPLDWRDSIYKPTPTIIEAAQALYRGHKVEEISRSDAGAINLSLTTEAIAEIIERSKRTGQKAICFVTGVPGAGKTLAGLNLASTRLQTNADEHAVFLSGNGPLVTVLRHALARSEVADKEVDGNQRRTKKAALTKAQAFIQNIHHFRDDALGTNRPPLEKVVVFDEAQRAWTLEQTASFMKRKRNVADFAMSEPQFLISIMDRHPDWAVIVCLVGGGQEINTGEAGLLEWFTAIRNHYTGWRVYLSPNLTDDEYTRGQPVSDYFQGTQMGMDARLHLAVSIRSFRAESMSNLIKALLDNNLSAATSLRREIASQYPIVVTRDIGKAREWLRSTARGTERYGILASSGGIRLRPIGINVKVETDVVNWFLNGADDIRSSYFLEEAATEFDVQGLELDWTCVVWDADLRYRHSDWEYKSFRGTNWQNINDDLRRRYLRNAYRVLLTRARQGMVVVVPDGNEADRTRKPSFYDGTFDYLARIGFEVL